MVKTLGLTNQCYILLFFSLPYTRVATKDVFGRNFVVFWLYLVEGEGGIARARGWVTGERMSVAGRYTQHLWHCISQLNKIQNTIYKIQNSKYKIQNTKYKLVIPSICDNAAAISSQDQTRWWQSDFFTEWHNEIDRPLNRIYVIKQSRIFAYFLLSIILWRESV